MGCKKYYGQATFIDPNSTLAVPAGVGEIVTCLDASEKAAYAWEYNLRTDEDGGNSR